jgi:CBS domain-containing protein
MMLARDVMTRDVQTVFADLTVRDLIEKLRATRVSGFPVVDAGGRVLGLISQNDVLRAVAFVTAGEELPPEMCPQRDAPARVRSEASGAVLAGLMSLHIADLMTMGVTSCRPEATMIEVCALMTAKRIHRVVVIDADGKAAGIISSLDVVQALGSQLRD